MTARNIVVATDLTARSDRAIERAIALAMQWGARLFVVHAVEDTVGLPDVPAWHAPIEPVNLARGRLRADLEAHATNAQIIVERGTAHALVLAVAADVDADLIVTGVARDQFLGPAKLGSTVEMLARRTSVPLLVVKQRAHGAYRHVVVASDFSKGSRSALATALEFNADARVTLFHAYDMPYASYALDRSAIRESGRATAEAMARDHLRKTGLDSDDVRILVEYGRPEQLLPDLARVMAVDLVVVGRGRGRVAAFFLGSVSMSVLTRAPTDVMLVPRHPAGVPRTSRATPEHTSI